MGEKPTYLHRIFKIEADSEEERQAGRALVAANMAELLQYVIEGALVKRTPPHPALAEWERFQRNHITQHMRKPQNRRLSELERHTGARIDHLALELCDVVQAWFALVQYRNSKAYRLHQEGRHQAERQAKLERRRREREARERDFAPRPKVKRDVHHEEVERCTKCHKRPAVKDHLCQPCLDWESAKLGR